MAMQVKGQSNGCVFTELLTSLHVAVIFVSKTEASFIMFANASYKLIQRYLEGMTQKQE